MWGTRVLRRLYGVPLASVEHAASGSPYLLRGSNHSIALPLPLVIMGSAFLSYCGSKRVYVSIALLLLTGLLNRSFALVRNRGASRFFS